MKLNPKCAATSMVTGRHILPRFLSADHPTRCCIILLYNKQIYCFIRLFIFLFIRAFCNRNGMVIPFAGVRVWDSSLVRLNMWNSYLMVFYTKIWTLTFEFTSMWVNLIQRWCSDRVLSSNTLIFSKLQFVIPEHLFLSIL